MLIRKFTLVLPISQLVDTMTVINRLKWIGWAQEAATEGLGILTNDGYRLIQLPVTLATAIGTSLLPAISEAIAGSSSANTKVSSLLASMPIFMKALVASSCQLACVLVLPGTKPERCRNWRARVTAT